MCFSGLRKRSQTWRFTQNISPNFLYGNRNCNHQVITYEGVETFLTPYHLHHKRKLNMNTEMHPQDSLLYMRTDFVNFNPGGMPGYLQQFLTITRGCAGIE
ncbi:hypothetical protein AVEN_232772-1 [Araneus ventricosus]|uniref:Uncharacterized protein n=1 Tax=Araneus ventricosus TaxID=182803 RepID=A0A4Y2KGT4_ARAVE|nr:hypothetical protein AVEN_232772-1 [Araneus ventricosus]